jgi:hypothetical protein
LLGSKRVDVACALYLVVALFRRCWPVFVVAWPYVGGVMFPPVTLGSHVTRCGMVGLVCGSVGTMFVFGGVTLKTAGWAGVSLGGGAVQSHGGDGVSSCGMTRFLVLGGADNLIVACGSTVMIVMFGDVCGGSSVCGGAHTEYCLNMPVS